MKQEDASLGPITLSRGLEEVHELHERPLEAKNRIRAVIDWIAEKVVARVILFEERERLGAVAEDHVIDALKGVAGDRGIVVQDLQVITEASLPMLLAEAVLVEIAID